MVSRLPKKAKNESGLKVEAMLRLFEIAGVLVRVETALVAEFEAIGEAPDSSRRSQTRRQREKTKRELPRPRSET